MNKFTKISLVVLVLGIGYLSFNSAWGTKVSGQVVNVDQSQIAFDGPSLVTIKDKNDKEHTIAIPSMGLLLCKAIENITSPSLISVGDMVDVYGKLDADKNIVPCEKEQHYLKVTGVVEMSEVELGFTYPKGPNGYVTLNQKQSNDANYITGVTLFDREEYEALQASTEGREAPTSIQIKVYNNPSNLHAPVWVERNPNESNISLALGAPEETVVGGANAIKYIVDGLYASETYAVAHGGYIYVILGEYLDKDSKIYKDFQSLVSSVTFIPLGPAVWQAKIDPRVACESALVYMTFSSGEEADAFIEACVRGEYPDVIDRYIKDLNLNEAAI